MMACFRLGTLGGPVPGVVLEVVERRPHLHVVDAFDGSCP